MSDACSVWALTGMRFRMVELGRDGTAAGARLNHHWLHMMPPKLWLAGQSPTSPPSTLRAGREVG